MTSQVISNPKIGFNLVSWNQVGITDAYIWEKAIQEMYEAGIRDFTVITYRFVNEDTGTIRNTSLYNLAPPPDDSLIISVIEYGIKLGMTVNLNPFIEIDNPYSIGHKWRGDIDFSGNELQDFFMNYRKYMLDMAYVAKKAGATRLYIGSELKTLSSKPEAYQLWLKVINDVRQIYESSGTLSYAANYNEYKRVLFWNQLDEIGIDAYFPLASTFQAKGLNNPSSNIMVANWEKHLAILKKFSEQYKKPIIISEWGAVPYDLTSCQPWNWAPSTTHDIEEQTNAYKATLEAIKHQGDWLEDVQFWHWGMTGNLESNYSITPDSRVMQQVHQYIINKDP